MKNNDKKEVQKKAVIIVTIILLIVYFIALTSILVIYGKYGELSNSTSPVIFLTVTVIIPLLGINIYSGKKKEK